MPIEEDDGDIVIYDLILMMITGIVNTKNKKNEKHHTIIKAWVATY